MIHRATPRTRSHDWRSILRAALLPEMDLTELIRRARSSRKEKRCDTDIEQSLDEAEITCPMADRKVVRDPVPEAENRCGNRHRDDGRWRSVWVFPERAQPGDSYSES